jgi:hypothetical protein
LSGKGEREMSEKFFPLKSMTKKEFMIYEKAFQDGMIRAYTGILNDCKVCIQAHRKEMTKKRLLELADMNKHLWKE